MTKGRRVPARYSSEQIVRRKNADAERELHDNGNSEIRRR